MATKDHLALAKQIKCVHKKLRDRTRKYGATMAWCEHLKSKTKLQNYASAMKGLATQYWEENAKNSKEKNESRNRILWSVNYCNEYFLNENLITNLRNRELRIEKDMKSETPETNSEPEILSSGIQWSDTYKTNKIQLLDVGSCYNPFQQYSEFLVTAIDIAPANDDVFECDFLNLQLGEERCYSTSNAREIVALSAETFDVIVFSLLLEYLPTSEQRILCCEKAFRLLRADGILIIITPDSRHVGVNAKLMKTWRYTLSLMGFSRIKYEKLEHITCMAFRKCPNGDVAKRWARLHKEDYMDFKIEIPQDKHTGDDIDMNEDDSDDDNNDKNVICEGTATLEN